MEKTTVMNNKIIDPGKLRSFQRVTSADGYFLICALDHLSDFQELLDSDRQPRLATSKPAKQRMNSFGRWPINAALSC